MLNDLGGRDRGPVIIVAGNDDRGRRCDPLGAAPPRRNAFKPLEKPAAQAQIQRIEFGRTIGPSASAFAPGARSDTLSKTRLNRADQKGFGFIQPDSGSKDVFAHATALERAGIPGLAEGKKVAFAPAEDRRSGKIAVNNIQLA